MPGGDLAKFQNCLDARSNLKMNTHSLPKSVLKRKYELLKIRSKSEMVVEEIFKNSGIEFVSQRILKWGKSYRYADFFLPYFRTIIEIDGGYHMNPITIYKDKSKDEEALLRHKSTLRIKNSQVMETIELLKNHLKEKGWRNTDFRRGDPGMKMTRADSIGTRPTSKQNPLSDFFKKIKNN